MTKQLTPAENADFADRIHRARITADRYRIACHSSGLPRLYETKTYRSPLADAQANLSADGRNGHYYDPRNVKFFKCRVQKCQIIDNGLILATLESVRDPDGVKTFRVRAFDIFGRVIHSPDDAEAPGKWLESFDRATPKAAERAFYEFVNALDADKITRAALARHAKRLRREADVAAEIIELPCPPPVQGA